MSAAVAARISKARTRLLIQQPFFGTLGLRLRVIEQPESVVPTMATDGSNLYYSDKFVETLTDQQLMGVIAHEVLHCALNHMTRRQDRDHRDWNRACDYAINPLVLAAGMELPKGGLIDHQYHEMSAEEIYTRIHQPEPPQGAFGRCRQAAGSPANGQQHQAGKGNADGVGSEQNSPAQDVPETEGGFGQVLDPVQIDQNGNIEPASPAEAERQAKEWQIATEQAVRATKNRGTIPGELIRQIESDKQEKIDWRETLRAFMSATGITDYSWSRPNRRYVAKGLYLPSTVKEGVGELVVAVDTSGSINDDALAQVEAELNAMSHEARPERIHVVYCDTRVTAVQEFEADEDIRLDARGGGGTCFRPPFAWVEANQIAPKALIYLTDLCCSSYLDDEPAYPVLWITDAPRNSPFADVPFGEVIHAL